MKWLELVKLFVPLALAQNPKTAAIAPFVTEGIAAAEGLKDAKGADKAKAAKKVAITLINARNAAMPGHTPIDVTAVDEAIDSGIETGVAVVNVVHKSTAPPTPA